MDFEIRKITQPTPEIVTILNRWENDPILVPFIRPAESEEKLREEQEVTLENLKRRLDSHEEYLIYRENRMIGHMSVQIDPAHIAKKEKGTAWIGIYIGDHDIRGRGAGTFALTRLEDLLKKRQLHRIELGVFEFNTGAFRFYRKLGFTAFERIDDFTWWQGRMWQDIRMEKYLD